MPAGRVVGPLPLMAVRQQQHHGRQLAPLGLAGADELVDDRLRAVDEVAELALPQHQLRPGCRPCSRTRSPTAAYSDSGESYTRNLPPVGLPSLLVASSCNGVNSVAGLAVDDHRMPLGEGAAAGVLSGQPHQLAFGHQRTQRQQLAEGPVDLAFVGHLPAPFQHRLNPRVGGESLGQRPGTRRRCGPAATCPPRCPAPPGSSGLASTDTLACAPCFSRSRTSLNTRSSWPW